MDVGRPPGIVVIAPRITSRLDGDEAVPTFVIGEGAAEASEIRIERGIVLVERVQVSSGSIRLPKFHQRARDGTGIFIEYSPRDDDPFAHRRLLMLASEVCDCETNIIGRELRAGDF